MTEPPESDSARRGDPGFARREGAAARRIAVGSAARMVGDVVAKLASIAFFITMARKLGDSSFGDFIFGLSLAQILMLVAGVGSEELIGREVARDGNRVHDLYPDVYRLKTFMLAALWLVMWAIVAIAGYPLETQAGLLLIGAGVAVENNTRTIYAVFEGLERNQLIAVTLVVQRGLTAIAGIVALLLGAKLLLVAAVYAAGSVCGQIAARALLHRRVVRPRIDIDPSRWAAILKRSAAFGIVSVGYLLLIRIDATMLSFLADGAANNSEVGYYGAAYRLIEATMFISWGFSGAMLPWLARNEAADTGITLGRGLGLALKVLATALGVVACAYVLFAEQLIDLLYGEEYAGAVGPMRIIGAMAAIYGLNSFLGATVISRGLPRLYARPLAVAIAGNVALNLYLIPEYGASGAAVSAMAAGILLLAWVALRVSREIAAFSFVRVLAAPLAGGVAAAAAVLAIGAGNVVPAAFAGLAAYGCVVGALELVVFRADIAFYRRALGRV